MSALRILFGLAVVLAVAVVVLADCDTSSETTCSQNYVNCALNATQSGCTCYGQLFKCLHSAGCLSGDQYNQWVSQCKNSNCSAAQCSSASSLAYFGGMVALSLIATLFF